MRIAGLIPSRVAGFPAALALFFALSPARVALANGFEKPVFVDQPVPPAPGVALPFPVVEEPIPTAAAITTKDLSRDAVHLAAPGLLGSSSPKSAAGASPRTFEGVVVRQSRVTDGKITIPPGGIAYFAEVSPAATPAIGAGVGLAGKLRFLLGVEQSIVTRKGVTLPLGGEPVVLGSSAFFYAAHLRLAGTESAAIASTSLAGYEWGRMGLGAFEVSLNQPSYHSKVFRDGLVQGRVEELTPEFVRFAWISATLTESAVLADEEVKAGLFGAGEEIPVGGERKIKVTRVEGGARRVVLETPDGPKTLALKGDPKRLAMDAAARRELLAVGEGYAVALLPGRSDFAAGRAHLAVYTKLRTYRRGEPLEADPAFRVYPIALPSGDLVGLHFENDKAIELGPERPTFAGPAGAFRVATTWAGGQLETFGLDGAGGSPGPRVSGKGRGSIDLVAGGGPTIESLLGRSGLAAPAGAAAEPSSAASSPASSPASSSEPSAAPAEAPAAPRAGFRDDPVGHVRPHAPWVAGGAGAGFLLAWLLGAFRRRRPSYID